MRLYRYLCFILIILFIAGITGLYGHPQEQHEKKYEQNEEQVKMAGLDSIYEALIDMQRELTKNISGFIIAIKNKNDPGSIFLLLIISLIYGLIHAIGPGHRKTFVFGYFVNRKAKIFQGIGVGFSIAFLHALSAVFLIILIKFILDLTLISSVEMVRSKMELISYSSITLIGLILLAVVVYKFIKSRRDSENQEEGRNYFNIPFIIASGLVPCPGASLIMIFSIAKDILFFGILSVLFMSLGMGITIASVALLTIFLKKRMEFLKESKTKKVFQFVIEIAGAVLIVLFGLFMALPYLFT